MTQVQEDEPYIFTASLPLFDVVQGKAQEAFAKPVSDLNFDEAAQLLGGLLVAAARHEGVSGTVWYGDRVVLNSADDGQEAVEGYARQVAKNVAPSIDAKRDIILQVIGKQTLWEAIRGRDPKVLATYHFRNEPPQYA